MSEDQCEGRLDLNDRWLVFIAGNAKRKVGYYSSNDAYWKEVNDGRGRFRGYDVH